MHEIAFNEGLKVVEKNTFELFRYITTFINCIAYTIVWNLLGELLAIVYFMGPSLMGVGFWNGYSVRQICIETSKMTPEFWEAHNSDCIELVNHKFIFFMKIITTLLTQCVIIYFFKNVILYTLKIVPRFLKIVPRFLKIVPRFFKKCILK